ncbi:MAG: hypothetical protein KAU06_04765 [Candidatus Marinimicrobia bacterium]|nr:hypothetical protein [Candidatus Neomarinimicrobiota bacterium]
MNTPFLDSNENKVISPHREAGTYPGDDWYFYTNTNDVEILNRVPDSPNWKIVKKAFDQYGKELSNYYSIWRKNIGEHLPK